MIIFGTKGRTKEIGRGEFFCPNCRTRRAYLEKRIARYFTLYFIPIFPIKNLGEYVECQVCLKTYKTDILRMSTSGGVSL